MQRVLVLQPGSSVLQACWDCTGRPTCRVNVMKIVFITVFIPLLYVAQELRTISSLACDLRFGLACQLWLFVGIFGYFIGFKSIFRWKLNCGLRRSYCPKISYFLKSDCWWNTWIWRKSWEPRGCSCCKSCQQQFPPHLFSLKLSDKNEWKTLVMATLNFF